MDVHLEKPVQRLGRTMTLGVMVDWVGDPYQMGVLSGVTDAISGAGANLLCFVGGTVPADPTSDARHRVFDLVGRHNVDGVVVFATTLMHEVGQSGISAYCKSRLGDLPYCSIGVDLDGAASVVANNERGVQLSVAHLVNVHNYQKIALVRGPNGNGEADRRYAAYVESLREHGLPFDPQLVFVGNFMERSGRDAVQAFSKLPGMGLEDLDAIVASNDGMAIGVLNALTERGIAVPRSIAITGFDDVDEARLTHAPLTTVRQPLEKIGQKAARNVMHWMNTGNRPDNAEVNTELVVRRSCGCTGSVGQGRQSMVPELNLGFEAALVMRRQHILDTLSRVGRGQLGVVGADWQARLLNAFVAEMHGDKPGAFGQLIEEYGQKLLTHGVDAEACHDVIDALRRQLTITLRAEPVRRDNAEQIFYAGHIALSDMTQRSLIRERFRLGRWVRDISYVCNQLSGAFDLTKLRHLIRENLPRVGLKSFFVVTYDRARGPNAASYQVGVDRGIEVVAQQGADFEATSLLPRPVMESVGSGRAFAVLPLAWNHLSLGHVLIELDLFHSFAYGPIAEAIGSGLYGAQLAKQVSG